MKVQHFHQQFSCLIFIFHFSFTVKAEACSHFFQIKLFFFLQRQLQGGYRCQDAAGVCCVRIDQNNRHLAQAAFHRRAGKHCQHSEWNLLNVFWHNKDLTLKYTSKLKLHSVSDHCILSNVLQWQKFTGLLMDLLILPQTYSWKIEPPKMFYYLFYEFIVFSPLQLIQRPRLPTNTFQWCCYELDQAGAQQQYLQ